MVDHCDKIIFNSISQLQRYGARVKGKPRGLRLESRDQLFGLRPRRPGASLQPSRRIRSGAHPGGCRPTLRGDDPQQLRERRLRPFRPHARRGRGALRRAAASPRLVSLGGGISFTSPGYALDAFCARLRRFAQTYAVTVYLEPGAAVVRQAATLEVSVVDIGCNGINLAVVDSSTEAHMLDLLIYREAATIGDGRGEHRYQICGKTCLAGDIFGEANFSAPLQIGDRLSIGDAGAYARWSRRTGSTGSICRPSSSRNSTAASAGCVSSPTTITSPACPEQRE